MEMLKKNVFWIICGLVALIGIGLSAWGLSAMAEVTTEMEQAGALQSRIQSAMGRAVNKPAIDAERARVTTIRENYRNVTGFAHKQNGPPPLGVDVKDWEAYLGSLGEPPETTESGEPKPLVPEEWIFPKAGGAKAVAFRDKYEAELARLRALLRAGAPPTQSEINDVAAIIKAEQPKTAVSPAPAPPTPPGDAAEEPKPSSGLISEEECRTSAPCRAAVEKARGIYCYLGDESLQVESSVLSADMRSLVPEGIWDAQRSLWVQQDVIRAIAEINNAVAEEIRKSGKDPWVGVLPVKDVISIRVSDYITEKSEGAALAKPGGATVAKPPGTASESFTNEVSSELYDTVQFTVKLVVDARHIPAILGAISRDRFHTLIRVSYAAEPPNLKMIDKIYGEDPVVNLVADFETYYFTEAYRPLMPKAILAKLGVAVEDENP